MAGNFLTALQHAELAFNPVCVDTLWVNITRRCNQTCNHCHVSASPENTYQMSHATVERCLEIIGSLDSCDNLDITGGAPELHPDFYFFVAAARKIKKQVTVRHNLTVTIDGDPISGTGKEYLPQFFADNQVTVLASLPFCTAEDTDRIRGQDVFRKSIKALWRLNSVGYGRSDTGLVLNLVCNRDGPVSLTEQARLESQFRKILEARHGIVFNSLLSVTNMPIGRFLGRDGDGYAMQEYVDNLEAHFSAAAVANLVCRHRVSVGCDGRLYDCDFNQMLGLQLATPGLANIYDFDIEAILNREIRFGTHCFGCTAGGGSN